MGPNIYSGLKFNIFVIEYDVFLLVTQFVIVAVYILGRRREKASIGTSTVKISF